jgi:glycosyltransferase involved in cell wall biosynthesis
MRKIIVLTPTKNEAWIIERFLLSVSKFADHIIILDQNSTDRTVEIVKKFDKVKLVRNASKDFNEQERQEVLLKEARNIGVGNVLISLDADEFFTPSFYSEEYKDFLRGLPLGISISFNWANIHWSKSQYWEAKMQPIIFSDDGSPNSDNQDFHRTRLPTGKKKIFAPEKDVKVIHLQYMDLRRLRSKHRWYQLHEVVTRNNMNFIEIYRKYHHMFFLRDEYLNTLPKEWSEFYLELGVNIFDMQYSEEPFWWDQSSVYLLNQISDNHLAKLDINFDLTKSQINSTGHINYYFFLYLARTQKILNIRSYFVLPLKLIIKFLDYILSRFW